MSNKVENIGKNILNKIEYKNVILEYDYFGEVYNRKTKRMERQ